VFSLPVTEQTKVIKFKTWHWIIFKETHIHTFWIITIQRVELWYTVHGVGWFVCWLVGYMVRTEANNVIFVMELFVPALLVTAWPWKWCYTHLRHVGNYSPSDRAWHHVRYESSVFVPTRFRFAVIWWRNECRTTSPIAQNVLNGPPSRPWRTHDVTTGHQDTSLLLTITSASLTSNTWFFMHCILVWVPLIIYELRCLILHL